MRSIYNGQGYYFNDDRCSGGKLEEADLLGCSHCHKPVKKADWRERGGFCMCCDKPICDACLKMVAQTGCVPFVAKLERAANGFYIRQQNSRIMGLGDDPGRKPKET